jgi:hypothetical protein
MRLRSLENVLKVAPLRSARCCHYIYIFLCGRPRPVSSAMVGKTTVSVFENSENMFKVQMCTFFKSDVSEFRMPSLVSHFHWLFSLFSSTDTHQQQMVNGDYMVVSTTLFDFSLQTISNKLVKSPLPLLYTFIVRVYVYVFLIVFWWSATSPKNDE